MKNSTVPRTPVRSILATVLLTALGFLALGLQSVWAQNSTGSNLGGAFAARTSSSGTSLLAPFYWIPTAGAGFSVSSGTTAAPGAPSPNFSYFHSLSTMTVRTGLHGLAKQLRCQSQLVFGLPADTQRGRHAPGYSVQVRQRHRHPPLLCHRPAFHSAGHPLPTGGRVRHPGTGFHQPGHGHGHGRNQRRRPSGIRVSKE